MSDELSRDERTEEATPRRREEALRDGRVALSQDLSIGLSLLAGAAIFYQLGPSIAQPLVQLTREMMPASGLEDLGGGPLRALLWRVTSASGQALGIATPAAILVSLITGLVQTGFNVTMKPLSPDLGKLSLIKGWQRVWSRRSGIRAAFAFAKMALLAAVAWSYATTHWPDLPPSPSLLVCVGAAWDLSMRLAIALSLTLVAIGLLDFLFQRSEHESDLRMTRLQLKEEMRESEGDPHLRARLKKLRRERLKQQMLQAVPTATAIITNPTHFAVAIKFDRETRSAPRVVAKGKDLLAQRIVEIARKHDVPIVERKPVARYLYAHVEVGQEIPSGIYAAVIEIFSYLLRLRGRL